MNTYNQQCSSRLPCGLCLITNQPCPYFAHWTGPYWTGPYYQNQPYTTTTEKIEITTNQEFTREEQQNENNA